MTMRKYIVTIHMDGSVSALEFEEPADQALTNYQAGFRDSVHEIVDSLERLRQVYLARCREYIQIGAIENAAEYNHKARAMYMAISELRGRYKVFGTRR